jgi:hypothetical protein
MVLTALRQSMTIATGIHRIVNLASAMAHSLLARIPLQSQEELLVV